MKHKTWKWIFGISLALLILLMVFTVFLWALANVGAVLFRLLFMLDQDMTVHSISFTQFMSNFIGSPLFYMYLVDIIVLISSMIGLIVTRKRK